MNKQYLGDGVYLERNEYSELVLTTEDGIRVTNKIVLEPQTSLALIAWIREHAPGLLTAVTAMAFAIGCAAPLPLPFSPTPVAQVPEVVQLFLTAGRTIDLDRVVVSVQAFGKAGATVPSHVTCTSTAGVVVPAEFDLDGYGRYAFQVLRINSPGTLTCTTTNGTTDAVTVAPRKVGE